MRLYDLRTEYRANPVGLTAEAPRFSWKMESQEKGENPGTYEESRTDPAGCLRCLYQGRAEAGQRKTDIYCQRTWKGNFPG